MLREIGVEQRIEVVPNGVNVEEIRSPKRQISREDYGIGEDDIVMLFVGRLGPEKNVSFLIRAFAKAVRQFDRGKLLLVGSGPFQEEFEQSAENLGISNKVIFTGRVQYEDVPSYIHLADAFVTASITEVHPLTLLEGMAAGLPALGIRSTGVEDIIEDGHTGFLTNNNFDEFSEKLLELMSHAGLRGKFRDEALSRSDSFSVETSANILLTLYRELVERRMNEPDIESEPMKRLRNRLRL